MVPPPSSSLPSMWPGSFKKQLESQQTQEKEKKERADVCGGGGLLGTFDNESRKHKAFLRSPLKGHIN